MRGSGLERPIAEWAIAKYISRIRLPQLAKFATSEPKRMTSAELTPPADEKSGLTVEFRYAGSVESYKPGRSKPLLPGSS